MIAPGRRGWAGALLSALAAAAPAPATAQPSADPRFPPGQDPGGIAVAVLSTGIDYTLPEIAARLARDGEGEPIAWDFVDNDPRPHAAGPRGSAGPGSDTDLVRLLLERSGRTVRLVAVRIDPERPASVAQAAAFVARTPARVALVPVWSPGRREWEPFTRAAARLGQVLFVAAAGDEGLDLDLHPAGRAPAPDNVLVVTAVGRGDGRFLGNWGARSVDAAVLMEPADGSAAPVTPSRAAAAWTAAAAAGASAVDGRLAGAALKQSMLERAADGSSGEQRRTRTGIIRLPP